MPYLSNLRLTQDQAKVVLAVVQSDLGSNPDVWSKREQQLLEAAAEKIASALRGV